MTRNILIYNKTPLLEQLLKQHMPSHYEITSVDTTGNLGTALTSASYDALLVNIPATTNTSILTDIITAYSTTLPILALTYPASTPLAGSCILLYKPLYLQEVAASLEDMLTQPALVDSPLQLNAHTRLFPARRSLETDNHAISLTEKEMALLQYLYEKGQEGANKEELLHHIWGYAEDSDSHTVETHIYRLRQKMGEGIELIITEETGYRLI